MYEKILLALGEPDARLVEASAAVAAPGGTIRVLHVRDIAQPARPEVEVLADAVRPLQSRGLKVAAEVHVAAKVNRKCGQIIAASAREFGADVVVLGTRGLSDLASLLRGSVSHDTLARLEIPVLVIRGDDAVVRLNRLAKGEGRLLLAVEGYERPESVAAQVAAIAPAGVAQVLHVVETVMTESYAYVEPEEAAQAAVAPFVSALRTRGFDTHAVTARPPRPVAEEITVTAQNLDADLVVVGSRRLGNLTGLLLDSVSHEVVHRHHGPVLIVDREASGPFHRSDLVAAVRG